MHESLCLYDTCLTLLDQERQALEAGEEEHLAELCEKRRTYLEEAWEKRAGCDPEQIQQKLEAILKAQAALTHRAQEEADILRMTLQNSRRENTRLNGYGKVVTRRQSALIVSKEG